MCGSHFSFLDYDTTEDELLDGAVKIHRNVVTVSLFYFTVLFTPQVMVTVRPDSNPSRQAVSAEAYERKVPVPLR